jgi:hypothetical protein
VSEGGLSGRYWGLSILFGVISLPVQQVINVVFSAGVSYKGYRMKKRLKRQSHMTTQQVNGSTVHSHRE